MATEDDWYLPNPNDEDEPLGPFSHEKLLAQLRKTQLRWDDFVWNAQVTRFRWHRFYEIESFQSELKHYPNGALPKQFSVGREMAEPIVKFDFSTEGEYGLGNLYRDYPRAPLPGLKVLIHNQKNLYIGQSVDISEKGLFASVEEIETFEAGEEVTVTIRNMPLIGTFSVPTVIVRKVMEPGRPQGLGLYFLRLNPQIARAIALHVIIELCGTKQEPGAA